jgi:hypothetical protein
MDSNTIIQVLIGVAGITGGFFGGKRLASGEAVSTAVEVVELLRVQVEFLTTKGATDTSKIADLRARVDILEGLVTQRAEVEAVHVEVQGVRSVVDKIAHKLEAS